MASFKSVGIVLVALALIILAVGCASTSPPAAAPPGSNQAQAQKVKLADTSYWPYAHLISGATLDSSAQAAMSGFSLAKNVLSDGSTQIVLKSTNQGYTDQTYTLKQGEQLYFIERTMGDDQQNQEFNLGDDTAVVVDANGYVVQ
jgi:hypothetical protein